jgi:hypothetical protein
MLELLTEDNLPPLLPPGVRGWLTPREALLLGRLAQTRPALELGAFCGKSTILLSHLCPYLVSVDWHQGDGNVGPQDTLQEYLANLRRHAGGVVVPLVGRVEQAGALLAPRWAGLIYVDGEHSEAATWTAVKCLEHAAAPGCVWVFHDYHLTGVQAAVARWVHARGHPAPEAHDTEHGVGVVRQGAGPLVPPTGPWHC